MENNNASNDKGMAIVAYFIFFLPLILAPNSQFAKYHANQGLVLLLAWIVVWVIGIVPGIGPIVSLLGTVGLIVLLVLGILNAAKGQQKPLPVIGNITIIK